MSVSASVAASTVNGRDVIFAIIGGTMLTLALTRPRLRWLEQMTEDSESARIWAERGLTLFLLTMAGYAASAVAGALFKQVSQEIAGLLYGAGGFLVVYAWLVNFEPFVREWRLRGGLGTAALYTCVMLSSLIVGSLLMAFTVNGIGIGDLSLAATAVATPAFGWLLYRSLPWFDHWTDRLLAADKEAIDADEPDASVTVQD